MRINELARELEVKAKMILDYLEELGVEGKKSHSSSVEDEVAEKVRRHFQGEASEEQREGGEGRVAILEAEPEEAAATEPPPAAEPSWPSAPAAPATSASWLSPVPAPPPSGAGAAAESPAAPLSEPSGMARPAPGVRAGTRAVLRPPIRTGAAKPVLRPLVPPLSPSRKAGAEAPSAGAVVAPPPPGPAEAPPPDLVAPKLGPVPLGPGRVSPVAGAPAAGTVPPGTIIRQPGAVPPAGTRPAGRPIYQPRRGAPGRPGVPMRTGAPAGVGVPGRPYERRPMHPTRARPAGAGLAPPSTAPAPTRQRPARPAPSRDRERSLRRMPPPPRAQPVPSEPLPITRSITITEGVTVKDLAEKLEVKAKDLMQQLILRGVLANINQALDPALATELSHHFGADASVVSFEEQAVTEVQEAEEPGQQVKRPPVVTVMGHVDHGKTSLLDAVRETHVTEQEEGGITQHIGAYQVEVDGRKITFIDTPGHEAFTRMRARGSKVTDVVVLVVAADDGVMPQTLEAIDHARAAKVPIIVALNKVDKPEALPERVKKQLADRGLMPEDWGGDTVFVEVSAKQRKNIDLLLEMVLLVSDIQELKANPARPAAGTVLEAKLDRGRGPVASVLVQNGTLRVGDPFIVGPVFSKVRALMDDRGRPVAEAPPAMPVEVLGLSSLPQAGDQFQVITDVLKAKQTALYREQKLREQQLARTARVTLEQLHEQMKSGEVKELPVILKGDVQGSAEVIAEALGKIATDKVKVKMIHAGVGAITESDVLLASASNAVIIGFNVRPERKAQELAEQDKVDIRLHTVIYDVTDEIRKALSGLLEPTVREVALGRIEVRQIFRIPRVGTVAGCYVQDGKVTRGGEVRLVRDGVVVYTGKVASLRRFKDDVTEVRSGFECGMSLENFGDIKPGDAIEAFVTERIAAPSLFAPAESRP